MSERMAAAATMTPRTSDPGPGNDWTVGGLLDWTVDFLTKKGSESPRLDAQVLLAHVLGCERIDLYGTRHGETASEDVRQRYRELIRRRVEGCPVAYLVGRKEFYSLRFEVGPAVLIPRPDTECLVLECLRLARSVEVPRILDLGTGSGNIAVAIAKQNPKARVTAVDISAEALEVAQRNAARHQVDIRFLHGDLYEPLPSGEMFDFVVSNPPYIGQDELAKLPVGVRDFEPRRALDGGADGFAVFDRLVERAPEFVVTGGHLLVEIGTAQEIPARQRLQRLPGFELSPTIHDDSGHPRVLHARRDVRTEV
jgi:release factor glutamine methyltransferase